MISFRSVTKRYGKDTLALDHVDLEVGKGEFVFLVGPSGAGKTTLMRMIYRGDTPTSGSVVVNGWDVGRLPMKRVPFLRREIGIVFQDFLLLSQRTVFDNIAFNLRVTEEVHRDLKRRVMEALEIVGLASHAAKYPNQLSAGEQQRIGIARAIVGRPLVLLGDEPTGNLDPKTSEDILRCFLDINRMGTTILMATHAVALVDNFRQRVVAIDQGRITRDELSGAYFEDSRPEDWRTGTVSQ
ncbi:MAG: cell division ATP-binding protein FtsE [Sulfobacillus sp.]